MLIVDNFNRTPGEDSFLDELLKYRLRILFTTRSRYEEQPTLEAKELDKEELIAVMGNFCEVKRNRKAVEEIISLLHRHTFAAELAARLLAGGMLRPKALVRKLYSAWCSRFPSSIWYVLRMNLRFMPGKMPCARLRGKIYAEKTDRTQYFPISAQPGREKGLPISGNFERTARCNFVCPMCYVHLKQENIAAPFRRYKDRKTVINIAG